MASTEVKNVTKGDQREASDLSFENSRKKDTRNAFLTGTFCKGRHSLVEYVDKGRYNASQVPAEWHGWLHFITDQTGDELLMLKPKRYGVEHRQNFSGEGDEFIYHSKGHNLNPGQRDWTRYRPWQLTKS